MPESLELWAVVLIGVAVILFVLEVLIPSGGLLGVMSALSLVGFIVVMFMIDLTYGWIAAVASVFIVPTAIVVAMKAFPHTPVGRRLILTDAQPAGRTHYTSTGSDDTRGLLDQQGVTVTPLYPGGEVKFDDRRVHCLAEHGMIDKGVRVRVVNVSGMEVKVREVQA